MWTIPNVLTSIRLLLIPVFLWFVTRGTLAGSVLALASFATASITDTLDGYFARKHGSDTDLGRFLDPFADKLLVLSAFYWGAFGVGASQSWYNIWLVHAIAVREIVITVLRTVHRMRGRQVVTAWAGKWKATVQMVTLSALLTFEAAARVMAALGSPSGWLQSVPIWLIVQVLFGIVFIITMLSGVRYFTVNVRTMPLSPTRWPERP